MRAADTDVARSAVCLSVCLSAGHGCEPCKTAEPIDMLFAGSFWHRKPCINFGYIHLGAIWRIRLNDLCSVAMRTADNVIVATCSVLGRNFGAYLGVVGLKTFEKSENKIMLKLRYKNVAGLFCKMSLALSLPMYKHMPQAMLYRLQ